VISTSERSGWLALTTRRRDGRSATANNALFALLGTTYGGNGTTNFNLPDLQGRMPLHAGAGANLPVYVQGQKAGNESIILTQQQMPMHTHVATFTPSGGGGTPSVNVTINGSNQPGNSTSPGGNYLAGEHCIGSWPG
jgi:microcystin-dependent protein